MRSLRDSNLFVYASRRRHTRSLCDWSSDVCSSDLVAKYGMTDLIYNHITARVPGPEHHILINAYGMLYEEVTASSLIKVDLAGNIIDNGDTQYSVNAAGYIIHSAVHEAREDAQCVIHTHTAAGIAVSAMEEGVVALSQTGARCH